ncbi:TOMM precursor leader peptide-binding protein [Candidatus Neptunochlamydia vexilliferae]|uniref:TOMM leader peptide-binding protein n=1 Tax=Candidatus Neptunichlamydia vexilliferae TaxID=1651774 RepID=A0ABS0AYG1_9BACT|nr:TOMM precursor leader peptide-binding protein [Candidatus Neptunochlamydia vexilliferae]MBF5059004.1 hypothetical protein [Candidatus Neptunochlamydia vexilliferae]
MKIKAYPSELIPTLEGAIVKRGLVSFSVKGDGVYEVLDTLLSETSESGKSEEEILSYFVKEKKRQAKELIENLLKHQFLYLSEGEDSKVEEPCDVFYWEQGVKKEDIKKTLGAQAFAFLGVNSITRQLIALFDAMGLDNYTLISVPHLDTVPAKKEKAFSYEEWKKSSSTTVAIACSENGNHYFIKEINHLCFEKGVELFPVILNGKSGYIGPVIVPWETACFECFLLRREANASDFKLTQAIEKDRPTERKAFGFHPALALSLAGFAFIELERAYGGAMLKKRVNTILEVNLLDSLLIERRILKVPYCTTCSPANKNPELPIEKSLTI